MCSTNHEIPVEFYSFEKDAPFENCIICNRSLLRSGVSYAIEKSYKLYQNFSAKDIIYEYAMCYSCMMELSDEISPSSKSSVQDYISEHANFIPTSSIQEGVPINIRRLLSKCVIKDRKISKTNEFTIYGMFKGRNLSGPFLPYMICDDALNEISECLSLETKEELEFFYDEFFSGPPEVVEILKSKPLIF